MPGNCPASLPLTVVRPVENIPVQAEGDSGDGRKLFTARRNRVRNHKGMVFSLRTESGSPSTGFPSAVDRD